MRDENETGWLALHGARMEGDWRRVYGQACAFCNAVARYGPWLEREALTLVRGNKARAKRLVRRALERLWEWDVTRFTAGDDAYLKRALVTTMGSDRMLVHRNPNRRDPVPRSALLLLLAFPLVGGRVAAQGFEGTITMTIAPTVGGQIQEGSMKTASRGDRTLTTLVMGASAGRMAGREVRTIADRKANTLTTLTQLPPGMPLPPAMAEAKGFMMVTPLVDPARLGGGASDTHPDIRNLGTSQTIAGMRCDDYAITEQNTPPISACITTALGAFAFPLSGRGLMGGSGSGSPGWATAFGGKPGFPLKIWGSDGKITLQVTGIDKTPVPDSAFDVPAGYVAMPGRGG